MKPGLSLGRMWRSVQVQSYTLIQEAIEAMADLGSRAVIAVLLAVTAEPLRSSLVNARLRTPS